MVKLKKKENETVIQSSHWFIQGLKLFSWGILVLIIFVLFYQLLPVTLLTMGHLLFLFGSDEITPSIVDVSIYLMTGLSLTGVLTYVFIKIQVNILGRARVISDDLTKKIRLWYRYR